MKKIRVFSQLEKLSVKKSLHFVYPILALLLVGSFLFFPEAVFAQQVADNFFGTEELGNSGLQTDNDIRVIIANVIRIILGFLGTIAVVLVLYAGFLYMTAGGNADKIERAKAILKNGLIGLVIILSSYGIVTFILNAITGIGPRTSSGGGSGPGVGGLGTSLGRDPIESHYPAVNAKGIPRNTKIIVTFKEKIKLSSIVDDNGTPSDLTDDKINSNVIIRKEEDPVESALAPEDVLVRYTPDQKNFVFDPVPLLGNSSTDTTYVVSLRSGIENINDEAVFGNLGFYEWSFGVSTIVDTTPPIVESVIPLRVDPPEEPKTYARNVVVQITFNEAVDPTAASGLVTTSSNSDTSLTAFQNIEIFREDSSGGRRYFNGSFGISNQYRTVEFLTDDKCGVNSCGQDVFCLPGNSTIGVDIIAATLSASPPEANPFPYDGVVDVAGNSFDGNEDGAASGPSDDNYKWNFKTNNNIDLVPPIVQSVTPGRYSVKVPLDSTVSALFSKPLLFKSLSKDTARINDVNYYVEAIPVSDTNTEVFIRHGGLQNDFVYKPEMTSGINDLYQNCFNPCEGPSASTMSDARSRDDARRVDLVLIKNALEEYKQKNGTYIVSGSGYNNGGMGRVTVEGGKYQTSILNKLIAETSLNDRVGELTFTDSSASYALYTCSGGRSYSLSAIMEDSSNFNKTEYVASVCNGGATLAENSNGILSRYGRNYALSNFNTVDARGEFTARDSLRKNDLSALDRALIRYNQENGTFPGAQGSCFATNSGTIRSELAPYLSEFFSDPLDHLNLSYVYANLGESYVLLTRLEFDQDLDLTTLELSECTNDTSFNGLYEYCLGGGCGDLKRVSELSSSES